MISRFAGAMFLSVAIASVSQVLLKKSALNKYDTVVREYLNPYVPAAMDCCSCRCC